MHDAQNAPDPDTLPTKLDPVARPALDDASRARIRGSQRIAVALAAAVLFVHLASRGPAGQTWILMTGVVIDVALSAWTLISATRGRRGPPPPAILPRKEMHWNLVQLLLLLILFAELFRTEAGRQVIFVLLAIWVPIGFLAALWTIFKGIRAALSRRK